jgi:hypothetical protein
MNPATALSSAEPRLRERLAEHEAAAGRDSREPPPIEGASSAPEFSTTDRYQLAEPLLPLADVLAAEG